MQNIIILTQRIENKKRYHLMEDTIYVSEEY